MRQSLRAVKQRVETLARNVGANCTLDHRVIRFDDGYDGAALSVWPKANDPTLCVCGRELTYIRVVWRSAGGM